VRYGCRKRKTKTKESYLSFPLSDYTATKARIPTKELGPTCFLNKYILEGEKKVVSPKGVIPGCHKC
jgi:hypothetical protein